MLTCNASYDIDRRLGGSVGAKQVRDMHRPRYCRQEIWYGAGIGWRMYVDAAVVGDVGDCEVLRRQEVQQR